VGHDRAAAGTPLPAEGQRVTPAYAAAMPKILTPNSMPAITTVSGAHHYRIVGWSSAWRPLMA
jgi:hypothetical protein